MTREETVERTIKAMYFGAAGDTGRYPVDEDHWRGVLTACYDRARDWNARDNHWLAMINAGPDLRPRLRHLSIPTVVITGTHDPVTKVEHGAAIADAIRERSTS